MKVIIAGSRNYPKPYDYIEIITGSFYRLNWKPTTIISGGAKGPDTWGEEWALYTGTFCTRFIPEWDKFGKSAGMMRNIEMGNAADALLAFWDGESRGTQHMINYMKKLKKPYSIITKPG